MNINITWTPYFNLETLVGKQTMKNRSIIPTPKVIDNDLRIIMPLNRIH